MRINCPHCRQSIEAADELAGSAASCPACEELFEIPEPASSPETPQSLVPPLPAVPQQGDAKEADFNPRVTGLKNIFWGGILLIMGLTGWFGGSIFTGDADLIDTCFDLLGCFWILVGAVQVCLRKQAADSGQAPPNLRPNFSDQAPTELIESHAGPTTISTAP